MRPVLAFAAAAVLVLASRSGADVPLPKDLKYVAPRVAFEGVEQHPDYVFHLRFLTFNGGPVGVPYTTVEVKNDKAFVLAVERRVLDFQLLALERKEFEKRAKADASLKWLTEKAEGVLAVALPTPSTVGKVTDTEVPVTTYRVAIKDGKLTGERGGGGAKGAAPGRSSSALVPGWAVGIIAAAGLAWLGLWWTRRA
jgi:hypothetical protein